MNFLSRKNLPKIIVTVLIFSFLFGGAWYVNETSQRLQLYESESDVNIVQIQEVREAEEAEEVEEERRWNYEDFKPREYIRIQPRR